MSSYGNRNWVWLPVLAVVLWVTLRVVTAQAVPSLPGAAWSSGDPEMGEVVDPELAALLARFAAAGRR